MSHIKVTWARRSRVLIALILALLLGLTTLPVAYPSAEGLQEDTGSQSIMDTVADIDGFIAQDSYAENDEYCARETVDPLTVSTVAPITASTVLAAKGETDDANVLFEIIDNRDGAANTYLVTTAIAQAATQNVSYNYSTTNTFGSPNKYSNVSNGVVITDLFENLGISMNGNDFVHFLSADGFEKTVLWDYLTAERYYYPNQPAALISGQAPTNAYNNPVPVPAIIALNDDDGTVMFGQRAPHEQTNDVFVKYMAGDSTIYGKPGRIILTDGNGASFPDITATTPASGATVNLGDEITFEGWGDLLGYSDGYIYFTTDGSEPTFSSSLYNYNTFYRASGAVFKPTIRLSDTDPYTGAVTLNVKVFGKGKYPSETATFTYYIDGYEITEREKQDRDAPQGLTGGEGRILGTTSEMEYSSNQTNWTDCTDGGTAAAAGDYYVRYKETDIYHASPMVSVSVKSSGGGGITPSTGVLAVYNGSALAKDFTQNEIDNLKKVTNSYSTYNTWPTYSTYSNITGVEIMELLKAAGLTPAGSKEITFYASDGFYATLKISDLTATRYYFDTSGKKGSSVPAVISFSEGGLLCFGQLAAQEQTKQAFVEKINRIVIGGTTGKWDSPTADPVSGSTVKKGDPIYLTLPTDSGDAKLYYTLDGSKPTIESAMYNATAERWFSQKGMTDYEPISAPSDDAFVISARIIGLGKNDGNEVKFTYNGYSASSASETGGSATVMTVETDTPVISFSAADLHEKIQAAVSEDGNEVLELRISTKSELTTMETKIPAESLKEMIDSELKAFVISTPLGSNSYDLTALQTMYSQGTGDTFTFSISKVDPKTLDDAIQAVAGDSDLYQIQVLRNNVPIESFGSGQAVTRLYYDLKLGQSAYGVKVWHLSADGITTEVSSTYNHTKGYVQFVRSSHSYYMVRYDAAEAIWTANPFKDVNPENWFHDNVRYVYEQNLMQGVTGDTFSPTAPITRGAVVTILWRLEGKPEVQTAGFVDNIAGSYYTQAVDWAAKQGIVNGMDEIHFNPGKSITRQDLATILHRYAQYKNYDVSIKENANLLSFIDADNISGYATESMQWACGAEIYQGSDNVLNPQGKATRVQMAAILERFILNAEE